MPQPSSTLTDTSHAPQPGRTITRAGKSEIQPDMTSEQIVRALIGPVIVGLPIMTPYEGAISVENAVSVWNWLVRDEDPDLPKLALQVAANKGNKKLMAGFTSRVATQISSALSNAKQDAEATRRLIIQLGGQETFDQLEAIQKSFKYQALLEKAVSFGKAVDQVRDKNALALALNSLPVEDPIVTALLMQACVGHISNPFRLVSVIVDIAEGSTENAVIQSGLAPFVDAIMAHAQNQLSFFSVHQGPYSDIDLACETLVRFHKLSRALSIITEEDSRSKWAGQIAILVRRLSDLIAPRIEKVDRELRQALRKPRMGADTIDSALLLEALNGIYLLAAAREAKDSLALNAIIEAAWAETGQALEILTTRNLDAYRRAPNDEIATRRLDAGIQMAIIRFNPEYGEILVRARDGAANLTSAG